MLSTCTIAVQNIELWEIVVALMKLLLTHHLKGLFLLMPFKALNSSDTTDCVSSRWMRFTAGHGGMFQRH